MEKEKVVELLIKFDEGDISEGDCISLFSHLVTTGIINSLEGRYGRFAKKLMESNHLRPCGCIETIKAKLKGEVV